MWFAGRGLNSLDFNFLIFKRRIIITVLCGEHLLCPAEQPVPILAATASKARCGSLAPGLLVHSVGWELVPTRKLRGPCDQNWPIRASHRSGLREAQPEGVRAKFWGMCLEGSARPAPLAMGLNTGVAGFPPPPMQKAFLLQTKQWRRDRLWRSWSQPSSGTFQWQKIKFPLDSLLKPVWVEFLLLARNLFWTNGKA